MSSTGTQPIKITNERMVFHSSENCYNVVFSLDNQEHTDGNEEDELLSVSPSNFLWYVN